MVQYSITPWAHVSDLLALRSAFYPFGDPSSPSSHQTPSQSATASLNAAKSRAVALVSLYTSRGNCPHLLASTSLLISASLLDQQSVSSSRRQGDALRCAYASAFGRFVTGLLDGYQSKKHKMSMYAIAKQIGLPSTFVELRHQCTHEELPGIGRLRRAVEEGLGWLWRGYWVGLGDGGERVRTSLGSGSEGRETRETRETSERRLGEEKRGRGVGMLVSGELAERMNVVDEIEREDEEGRYWELERELGDEGDLKEVMRRYLIWRAEDDGDEGDQHVRMVYSRRLLSESMEDKLEALEALRDSGESTLMLASMKLFREIMNGEADVEIFREGEEEEEEMDITRDLTGRIDSDEVEPQDDEDGEEEGQERKRMRLMMEEEEDREEGWRMWEGPWVPKPIGVV